MKAKQSILSLGVWYFLITGPGFNNASFTFTQVGPFATRAACQNYQAGIIKEFGPSGTEAMTDCFSTTASK